MINISTDTMGVFLLVSWTIVFGVGLFRMMVVLGRRRKRFPESSPAQVWEHLNN